MLTLELLALHSAYLTAIFFGSTVVQGNGNSLKSQFKKKEIVYDINYYAIRGLNHLSIDVVTNS